MTRSRGFTLIELLTVVGIFLALLAVFLVTVYGLHRPPARRDRPSGPRAPRGVAPISFRGRAMQAICASNLRNIGTGLAMYASIDERDVPPILPDIDQSQPVDYRQDLRMGADCTAEALGTGAQQNLCLLVKTNSITWELLICPASGTVRADRSSGERKYGLGEVVNGQHKSYIDYALQIPYLVTPDGSNSCPSKPNMDTAVVIMGDRGPMSKFKDRFSPNHGRMGENLLYGDFHAEWREDKGPDGSLNASGYDRNNIYTADVWEGTPENPTLKSNGTENKTPTDPTGTKDSVLYHRW